MTARGRSYDACVELPQAAVCTAVVVGDTARGLLQHTLGADRLLEESSRELLRNEEGCPRQCY